MFGYLGCILISSTYFHSLFIRLWRLKKQNTKRNSSGLLFPFTSPYYNIKLFVCESEINMSVFTKFMPDIPVSDMPWNPMFSYRKNNDFIFLSIKTSVYWQSASHWFIVYLTTQNVIMRMIGKSLLCRTLRASQSFPILRVTFFWKHSIVLSFCYPKFEGIKYLKKKCHLNIVCSNYTHIK